MIHVGWGPLVRLGFVALVGACSGDDSPLMAADAAVEPGATNTLTVSPTHSCALREAGLYCWGQNFAGQLGDGTVDDSESAVQAQLEAADVVELRSATGRTCVRRSAGTVACWGLNDAGQIGDGSRERASTLRETRDISDARQLAIDDHSTCVLRAAGSVSCWGRSPEDSPEEGTLAPREIPALAGAVELRAGAFDTYCARHETGWVRCIRFKDGTWGEPVDVPALAGAVSIAVPFEDEVCGVVSSGAIYCSNLDSGNSAPLDNSGRSVELVGAGGLATCARNTNAEWSCWNVLPSMLESVGSPRIPIATTVPIVELAISGFNMCALYEDHSLTCVNANDPALKPGPVAGLPP
ncbi:MAG: hypothetical protein ABW321_26225 [Polyangiales bacterium]